MLYNQRGGVPMNNIRIVVLAAAALWLQTGCKKDTGASAAAMAKMDVFRKDMCACKDKPCADAIDAAMLKWSAEMAKSAAKEDPADLETIKEMTAITTKYGDCYRAMVSAAGSGSAGSGSAQGSGSAGSAGSDSGSGSADDEKPDKKDDKTDDKKADKKDDKKAGK
jgi:hypothetical protein